MIGHDLEQFRERPDRHAVAKQALQGTVDAGDRQHARHDLVDDRGLRGTKRFDQTSHRVPG